jgi:hypothetical protein
MVKVAVGSRLEATSQMTGNQDAHFSLDDVSHGPRMHAAPRPCTDWTLMDCRCFVDMFRQEQTHDAKTFFHRQALQ